MPVRPQPAPRPVKPSRAVSLPLVSALFFAPSLLPAQQPAPPAQPPASAAPQATGAVRGLVADPDDAEIPGATVTLAPASGKSLLTTSSGDGTYTLRGVPPGTYTLTVTMPGFAAFVRQGIRITAGTPLTLNAKMAIQNAEQVVTVTSDQAAVSVDPGSNASSTVLSGKDLDALSDDPDELSSELTALAGPSSGPNGGQIYIDGFTGGQLPPKSSIREIRINQNPFSAQYDRPGFGRVEIFTKPGTDKFHGSAQLNGQDKAFNTGSPFINNAIQPGYHTIFFLGSLTGPINRNASFSAGGSYRDIQNVAIVNPPALYATSQTSGVPCLPGTPGCNLYTIAGGNGYSFGQFTPQTRFDFSPRLDLALGEKNTLTARFQYEHNNQQEQGVGGNTLPQNGAGTVSGETELQLSDTQIVSDRVINETRFEYQRSTSTTTPYSTAPQISVQGAFTAGGSASGTSQDTQNHFEAQNYTSVALARHFIRLGGRLRYTGQTNTSTAQSNGIFSYNSIDSYLQTPAGCTALSCAGSLSDFTVTAIQFPTVFANTADVGIYAEDDWKIKPAWTLSFGIRYEAQNFIHDKNDWAPRFSTAYGLGKKTVLRVGGGIFYERFGNGNQLTTIRNNGINQQQFTLSSRSASAGTLAACNPANPYGSSAAPYGCQTSGSRLTIDNIAYNLRAPYTAQENLGIDQQLFRNATLSVNYQYIRGVHQFNSDVPGYNLLNLPLNYQFQSNGVFTQKQLIANLNVRNFHGVTFGGFYALNFAKSDTGPFGSFSSVPNNLAADYGRASFDTRHRIFLYGSTTLPHLITLSPLIAYQSGSPYNITSGLDLYGDNIYNSRAVFAPAGTPSTVTQGFVKSIPGCGTFATPGTAGATGPVPINYCTGPGAFTTNLRIVKTFGFGPQNGTRPDRGQSGQRGGPQGGPGGPGGPGGGGGGRGGGGGFGGGGASSGKRYNASFGVQIQNLFNDADRGNPNGTLTSPSFGTSTNLAGNLYTSGSALRRIYLQGSFSF